MTHSFTPMFGTGTVVSVPCWPLLDQVWKSSQPKSPKRRATDVDSSNLDGRDCRDHHDGQPLPWSSSHLLHVFFMMSVMNGVTRLEVWIFAGRWIDRSVDHPEFTRNKGHLLWCNGFLPTSTSSTILWPFDDMLVLQLRVGYYQKWPMYDRVSSLNHLCLRLGIAEDMMMRIAVNIHLTNPIWVARNISWYDVKRQPHGTSPSMVLKCDDVNLFWTFGVLRQPACQCM